MCGLSPRLNSRTRGALEAFFSIGASRPAEYFDHARFTFGQGCNRRWERDRSCRASLHYFVDASKSNITNSGTLAIGNVTGSSYPSSSLTIANADFEIGADDVSELTPISGWTSGSVGGARWWLSDGSDPSTGADPPLTAANGTLFLNAARNSTVPDTGSQHTDSCLTQLIDLSSYASQVDAGGQSVDFSFLITSISSLFDEVYAIERNVLQ